MAVAKLRQQTARKMYHCGRCGKVIEPGEKYFRFAHFRQPKQYRCLEHRPRPSELESNDKLSSLYSIQESLTDDLNSFVQGNIDVESLTSSLENAADEARTVGEQYGESADNMESGWPNGHYMIDELREKADACEDWATELESAKQEIDDEEAPDETIVPDDENKQKEEYTDRVASHFEQAVNALSI